MSSGLPSFASLSGANFDASNTEVGWHDRSEDDGVYVLRLGRHVTLYVLPDDARALLTKLVAKMIERGDLPETELVEALAVRVAERVRAQLAAAAEAETRQWDIVNAGGQNVAEGDDQPDLADVTVISDERLAELREQLAAEKRIGDAS